MKYLALFVVSTFTLAGGPALRNVEGNPISFNPNAPLFFHVENGVLGNGLTNETLQNIVADAFETWESVPGNRLNMNAGVPINLDIQSLDQILGFLLNGLNPIVFDEDGSILASIGLSPDTDGVALQFGFDGQYFAQLVIVINGPANAGKSEAALRYTILRFIGQAIGLSQSVVNGDLYTAPELDHPFGTVPVAAVEVLYPNEPGDGQSNVLKTSDRSDLLAMYGDTPQGTAGFGAIEGVIFDANGNPTGGVNVIARMRSGTPADVFFQAASSISHPLTGEYRIVGLPPGEYSLEVYDIARRNNGVFGDPIKTDNPNLPANFLNLSGTKPEITGKFPGDEEFYSGSNESNDPYTDLPSEWQPIPVNANVTTAGINITFNRGKDEITRLLYPWVSNNAGSFEAILIANNYGDQAVEVTLSATRNLSETETVTRIIPAGGFLREQASSLFPQLGSGSGYSVLLTAPSTTLRGNWVTNSLQAASGQSPSQGVAVEIPGDDTSQNERLATKLLFGYLPLTDELISAPVVVNSGDKPTDIALTFYNTSGEQVASSLLEDVPPWVPFASVANNLVPEGNSEVMMIAESADQRLTGVSFVFNQVFLETAIGNASGLFPDDNVNSKTLVYPWISNNEGSFESVFIANNLGDSPLDVTLTARRNSDPAATQSVVRTIPAMGFLQESAASLFDQLGSGPGYSVTLEAPSRTIAGQWVTNNLIAESGLSPSQGVAVVRPDEGSNSVRTGHDILLGYLPLNDAFTSAPVLVNLGSTPADIRLSFYDEDGNRILQDNTTLSGQQPLLPAATLANALLPENSGDVFLIASSDQPITGVVFVFNTEFFEPAIGNAATVAIEDIAKTAFVNVNLLTMENDQILPNMTVVVEGQTITMIGPTDAVNVPDDVTQIDGTGRFLMPGLSDAHMHLFEPGDFDLYLANGITSGLSMGDSGYEANNWRDEILRGERHGPRVYTGNFFRGLSDGAEPNLTVVTPEQGREHVRNSKALGYDFVKVYSGLTSVSFDAIMDEAQQEAMPVIGHVPQEPGLEKTLAAGVRMIAHSEEYWNSIFGNQINESLIQTAVDLSVEHGVYVTATMAVVEALPQYLGQNQAGFQAMLAREGVAYMDPSRIQNWIFDFATETADPGIAGERLPFMRQYTKALFDAGVPILAGTDATVLGMVPGYGTHLEFDAMERVGLTPFQVLQSATGTFGDFIQAQLPGVQPFGRIKEGHRADFLLLEANPLLDLDNVQQRAGVMARGIWYSENDLQQRLEDLAASYQEREKQ